MSEETKYLNGFYGRNISFNNGQTPTSTVYSDRLFQWDSSKYNTLRKKHFGNEGQSWGGLEPDKIEAFLSDYIGNEIKICRIEQEENKATGYPLWRFDYESA